MKAMGCGRWCGGGAVGVSGGGATLNTGTSITYMKNKNMIPVLD
jgi:hypothetical protein